MVRGRCWIRARLTHAAQHWALGALYLFTMCCKNLGLAASLKDEFNKPWISGCLVSLCLFGVVEELGGSVFESNNSGCI